MNIFKNKLFKTGVKYSTVSTIKTVISMLSGLVIMFWLAPDEVGKWNAVSIFLAYTPFLQLGIQTGLSLDLPVLLGKKDQKNAVASLANGFGYAIMISIIILITGIVMTFIFYYKKGLDTALGIVTITIIAFCSSYSLHFIARYRSAQNFDQLVKAILIEIPFDIVSIYFIYRFHYYGILLYNVIIAILPPFLMYQFLPYKEIKPRLKKMEIFQLGKTGFALMIQNQLQKAAQTLPRWIILTKSGVEKLGLFTPAAAVNMLIDLLPSQIGNFIHPQMGFVYGQTGKAKSIWPYVWKLNIILPILVSPIAIAIWFLSPWLLETFFPKYIESMWAMRIMGIAFVFSSSVMTSWALNTIHAFQYVYVFIIFNFVGSFVFPYIMTLVLSSEDILTAVTIGLAINNFVCYIVNFVLLRVVLFKPKYNLATK